MKSGSDENATPPSRAAAATDGDDGGDVSTADGSTTNPGAAGVEDGRKLVSSVVSLGHCLLKQRGVAPDLVCFGHSLLVCCRYSIHMEHSVIARSVLAHVKLYRWCSPSFHERDHDAQCRTFKSTHQTHTTVGACSRMLPECFPNGF